MECWLKPLRGCGINFDFAPAVDGGVGAIRLCNSFGWKPQTSGKTQRDKDEDLMDLTHIIARNSLCREGHMGCVIVRHSSEQSELLGACTNAPIFCREIKSKKKSEKKSKSSTSDVHAELGVICLCAARGVATAGSTLYVMIPPCRKCFSALATAGVTRVVSRKSTFCAVMIATAATLGIEMVEIRDTRERLDRVNEMHKAFREAYKVRDNVLGKHRTENDPEHEQPQNKKKK